jgi:hypothetical protein
LKFLLLFCFIFASFNFCFASDVKTSEKKTFFASKQKNFASVSLHFALKQKLWQFSLLFLFLFRFTFVLLQISTVCNDENQAKKRFFRIEAKKFLLPFRFISLRSENDGAPYSRHNQGYPGKGSILSPY